VSSILAVATLGLELLYGLLSDSSPRVVDIWVGFNWCREDNRLMWCGVVLVVVKVDINAYDRMQRHLIIRTASGILFRFVTEL
jgi:hypothetical protein